jgi:hypothetical protein
MKLPLLALTMALATPLWADDLNQTFEGTADNFWTWGKGRNSSGSAEISTEKAYSGVASTKILFNFTDDGWIELSTAQGAKIEGDAAYLSLWATGLKNDDFAATAVRFTDKNGETFQYEFPALLEAGTSPTWKEARAKIDLTQPKINWGPDADGILDKPIRFSGFGLTRKRGTSGTLFIDDLKVSETEIPAAPVATNIVAKAMASPMAEAIPVAFNSGRFSGGAGPIQFSVSGAKIETPDAATFAGLLREGKALDITSGAAKWRIESLAGWRDALPMESQQATDTDSSGQLEKAATGAHARLLVKATPGKNKYVQFPVTVDLPTDTESLGAIYTTSGTTPLVMAVRTQDARGELMGFVLGNTTSPATRVLQKPNYRWGAPDSKTATAGPQGQTRTFGLILEANNAGVVEADIESLYVVRRVG